ncbi:hypothetical protein [Botrimarina hoheduenensis]|uniref:hypothetical protein n=1 Tax=Botrimarina hoheduenensis TaxID=2528000 RepID=UPI0011B4C49A|nr:hypothetical protein [Botrimarina hoheduenensis]
MPDRLTKEESTPSACECLVTQRGPNWLFVSVSGPDRVEPSRLAEQIWSVAQEHFTYRLVVELSENACRPHHALYYREGLRLLQVRLEATGGALRLCGLRPEQTHEVCDAPHCDRLRNHATPRDAVTGHVCGDQG